MKKRIVFKKKIISIMMMMVLIISIVACSSKDETKDETKDEVKEFDLHDYESAVLNPISTFSIDVDTVNYPMIRNYLDSNRLPYSDDVRFEEMINYFDYNYENPDNAPFSINTELGVCPWEDDKLPLL